MSRYVFEHVLIAATMLLTVSGFWNVYFGERAAPGAHHHLHLLTIAAWLLLLRHQLGLVGSRRYEAHARIGTAILLLGPLLVASGALLTVHSAAKGLASGGGDFMIVQNAMTTLVLGLLIVLAFVLRKRRKLHGNLLLSTTVLFLGIATFFTLVSFVPPFVVTGPETFHRFRTAATAGKAFTLLVSILFFARDVRHGWPFLLAGASFLLNDLILWFLAGNDLVKPLTALVGAMSQVTTFAGTAAVLLAMLVVAGVRTSRSRAGTETAGDALPALDRSS